MTASKVILSSISQTLADISGVDYNVNGIQWVLILIYCVLLTDLPILLRPQYFSLENEDDKNT